jgi:hypothetical protein
MAGLPSMRQKGTLNNTTTERGEVRFGRVVHAQRDFTGVLVGRVREQFIDRDAGLEVHRAAHSELVGFRDKVENELIAFLAFVFGI